MGMAMTDQPSGVIVERDGVVLRIVIDRPDRKGSLHPPAVLAIIAALESASTDDTLRVVVLSSTGDNFCSGADWVATNTSGDAKPRPGSIQRRTPVQAHRLIQLLMEIQLPVVCAVRGWAAGLGCQIALAADFAVASEDASFWLPFMRRGFTPDSGATWLLPRLVGVARAKQMLMLARPISGAEAAGWGMIHEVVPVEGLEASVAALVDELAAGPTVALGLTKMCINRGLDGGIVEAMADEAMALELSSRTADFREGLTAFRERRQPDFGGR